DERFGARRDVASAMQHDLAQFQPELRAAGFPSLGYCTTRRLQPVDQQAGLGRLPRPVAALKRDEDAGPGCCASPSSVFVMPVFFAAGFFAAGFLAAGFLSRAFFFAPGFFLAGPFARFSANNCTARSKSTSSTVSPRGMVALVMPSVTYAPKRPSLILIGLPLSGSSANSLSALEALRAPYLGCANSSTAPARSMSKIWSSLVRDRVSVPFFRY